MLAHIILGLNVHYCK